MRPQRTSVARLTTGESTCRMPRERVSRAMAVATRPISAVSQVAARPMACGKTVAPGRVRPWTASSNGTIGMPRRVRSTKKRWTESIRSASCSCVGRGGNLQAEDAVAVVVRGVGKVAGDHEQLPELLLERHPREEVGWRLGGRRVWECGREQEQECAEEFPHHRTRAHSRTRAVHCQSPPVTADGSREPSC